MNPVREIAYFTMTTAVVLAYIIHLYQYSELLLIALNFIAREGENS